MSKKKALIIVVSTVVLVAIVAIVIILLQKPSKSVVTPRTGGSGVKTEQSVALPINTAYFTATLPVGFKIKSQTENATASDILQIVATQNNSNGQQIGINLATIAKEGLGGVASYNLRVKNPDIYKPIEFGGMPANVPTFYNRSETEYGITGFWVRDGLYASIAVAGTRADEALINQHYMQLLDSWRWR